MLYPDLENDNLINGQVGTKLKISNGVNQDDILSCSLFLLAIEPVIKNIEDNYRIQAETCNRLGYTWPKVLAYTEDISIFTKNTGQWVNGIFKE